MTGKAGAPLTEAMFYVLMALRRGELCGTEIAAWTERCTEAVSYTHLTLPTT